MSLPATTGLDLIGPERLQQLCEHLFEAFGIATSIVTTDGHLIARGGRNSICSLFYHQHPEARRLCANFDDQIIAQLKANPRARIFKCRHGIIEAAIPLLVNGEMAGILFSGQFFFNPPDPAQMENFAKQAESYAFDKTTFIQAVSKLPIISRPKSKAMVAFFSQLAGLIVDLVNSNALNRQRAHELEQKSSDLEELNRALKIILDNRAIEKKAIEADLMTNVRKFILPYIDQLEKCGVSSSAAVLLNIIRSNIDDLLPPLTGSLTSCYRLLTPAECRVADLVRQGLSTKQIADTLYLSPHTVTNIRNSIRKKLGLTGRKQNLKTFLNTFDNNYNQ